MLGGLGLILIWKRGFALCTWVGSVGITVFFGGLRILLLGLGSCKAFLGIGRCRSFLVYHGGFAIDLGLSFGSYGTMLYCTCLSLLHMWMGGYPLVSS